MPPTPEPKTRERCGADVEVMFYPSVPCNRFKGHEGDHEAAPAPTTDEPTDEDAEEPI